MIEVHEFVKTEQIDPLFHDRLYSLEPDLSDIQGKGFNALAKALKEPDVAGICTWTMRKRSYFGALQAHGKMLRLNTLRYADQVIPVGSLDLKDVSLSEKELKIGSELIEKLTLCAYADETPANNIISTASWGYLRLRRSDYTDADLSQWLERILW